MSGMDMSLVPIDDAITREEYESARTVAEFDEAEWVSGVERWERLFTCKHDADEVDW